MFAQLQIATFQYLFPTFSWQLQSFLNVEIKCDDHLIVINLLLISEQDLQTECNLSVLKLFPWNMLSLHSLKYLLWSQLLSSKL